MRDEQPNELVPSTPVVDPDLCRRLAAEASHIPALAEVAAQLLAAADYHEHQDDQLRVIRRERNAAKQECQRLRSQCRDLLGCLRNAPLDPIAVSVESLDKVLRLSADDPYYDDGTVRPVWLYGIRSAVTALFDSSKQLHGLIETLRGIAG